MLLGESHANALHVQFTKRASLFKRDGKLGGLSKFIFDETARKHIHRFSASPVHSFFSFFIWFMLFHQKCSVFKSNKASIRSNAAR